MGASNFKYDNHRLSKTSRREGTTGKLWRTKICK
jgi:hypothetical protein